MKDNNPQRKQRIQLWLSIGILQLMLLALLLLPSPQEVMGQAYYSNITIRTTLNISNAAPIVTDVKIFDNDSLLGGNVQLTPGSIDLVYCNATVNDSNGWEDINYTNGTLFINGNWTDANDFNVRYENSSCRIMQNDGQAESAFVTCSFPVRFFANNATWNCSIQAEDNSSVSAEGYMTPNGKIFDPLYAIRLDTTVLNYGVLNITQVSSLRTVNVTNAGNMFINLSVEGYGSALHDDLSMNCTRKSIINISQQRYAINPNVNWSTNMTYLTTNPLTSGIINLTIPQNQDDNGNVTNTTYWAIQAPRGAETGQCNGSLVFSAIPTERW